MIVQELQKYLFENITLLTKAILEQHAIKDMHKYWEIKHNTIKIDVLESDDIVALLKQYIKPIEGDIGNPNSSRLYDFSSYVHLIGAKFIAPKTAIKLKTEYSSDLTIVDGNVECIFHYLDTFIYEGIIYSRVVLDDKSLLWLKLSVVDINKIIKPLLIKDNNGK